MNRERCRLSVSIRVRVQAVSFGYHTLREARRLGLNGWVRNERDGSVRAVVEGDPHYLEEFIGFLRRGSPGAKVMSVDVKWLDCVEEFDSFEIRWV